MHKLVVLCSLASTLALAAEEPRHVYRLDFTVAEHDAGKAPTSRTYTMNLEERRSGEIKMGTNVALSVKNGPSTRADIGLALHASFVAVGDELLLDDDLEISAATDSTSFRKMSTKGNALVAPGKPALVASIEDPVTRGHYDVTVTATKLR